MKHLIVLFVLLFAGFLGSWTYKIKTPINRPDEYAEGYNTQAGAWWEAEHVEVDDSWRLDPEIPLNYIPVPGENELYMVIDNNGNILGYRKRTKQIDGSWKWEDVNPDIPDNYIPVEGLENVYAVIDENGNVTYKKYIRNDDNTFAFVDVDQYGNRIDKERDATTIDGRHIHISGNLYSEIDGNGVIIGYDKRVPNGDGTFSWLETDMPGFGNLSEMGEFDLSAFSLPEGGNQMEMVPLMSTDAINNAAAAMAAANDSVNAGNSSGDFTINFDMPNLEAEYGNGYGDGYGDGFFDGMNSSNQQYQQQYQQFQQQNQIQSNTPTLPTFDLPNNAGNNGSNPSGSQGEQPEWFNQEEFNNDIKNASNPTIGSETQTQAEQKLDDMKEHMNEKEEEASKEPEWWNQDEFDNTIKEANTDKKSETKIQNGKQGSSEEFQESEGYHTETQVVKEKRNVNGIITSYETYVRRTYDDNGVLVSTKSEGPYVVNDDQKVSQDGTLLQVMSGAKESTLQNEFSRISGYFTYDTDTENQVAAKLNAQRSSNGINTLSIDQNLSYAAKLRASDMAAHDSDGSNSYAYGTVNQMLSGYGVSFQNAGENTWKTIAATADDIHTRLQALEDSRNERMSSQYSRYGVGVVVKDDYVYICEVFA